MFGVSIVQPCGIKDDRMECWGKYSTAMWYKSRMECWGKYSTAMWYKSRMECWGKYSTAMWYKGWQDGMLGVSIVQPCGIKAG